MAAKDGERPLVLYLKTGPRPTSPPISAFVFALVVSTSVDPLDGLGGDVSRPGWLVFRAQHNIFRHLLRTRFGFGGLLPRLPSPELPFWVFFLEGDVESLLQKSGRNMARAALGGSDRQALFRLCRGFLVPPSPRFHKPPSHPGRSDFPRPVGSSSFPQRTFPNTPKLKHSPAYAPWVHSYTSSSTSLGF